MSIEPSDSHSFQRGLSRTCAGCAKRGASHFCQQRPRREGASPTVEAQRPIFGQPGSKGRARQNYCFSPQYLPNLTVHPIAKHHIESLS